VSIELDYNLVVDGIVIAFFNHTEFRNILIDYRILLGILPNFNISFISRKTHFVAHTIHTHIGITSIAV
jgi:hypothetical protein